MKTKTFSTKLAAVFTACTLVFAFSLVGCAGTPEENTDTTVNDAVAEEQIGEGLASEVANTVQEVTDTAEQAAEATHAEDTATSPAENGGTDVATQSSNSGNTGSTSAPAASAPSTPAHQHSWEPVYSTTSVVVCTCCDGTTFTGSGGIARYQAALHEVALGNAHPDECHGNSHISQSTSTQQTKTGERCSGCGATR